jgi:hypothetical protein
MCAVFCLCIVLKEEAENVPVCILCFLALTNAVLLLVKAHLGMLMCTFSSSIILLVKAHLGMIKHFSSLKGKNTFSYKIIFFYLILQLKHIMHVVFDKSPRMTM